MSASHSLVPNQIFLRKKTLRCEKVELGELSPCSKPSKQWEFLRLRKWPVPQIWLTKKLLTMGWMQLGHVCVYPCMSQTFIIRWFSPAFLENKSFDFPWMQILFMYWSRGLFLGMVQPKSRFRKLKWVYGTTQEFVSGTFRSINSNTWSRKKCGFSYINLVQTVDDKRILCCVLNSPLEQGESTCTHFHRLDKFAFSQPLVYESCLYWSRGLFLRMVQHKSRFCNVKRDGTTQEIVSGTFRVYEFQFCLLAKYFVSVSNCSCSHIHFVQTVEEKLRNRSFAVS